MSRIRPLLGRIIAPAAAVFFMMGQAISAQPASRPATQPAASHPATKPVEEKPVGDPYTLATCPVSGEQLGSMGDPIVVEVKGREFRLCCSGCTKRIENEPEKFIPEVDKKMTADQKRVYPLDTCIVSGEELPPDEDRVYYIHNNRLFELCCEGCVGAVKSDPEKYMKKLDDAVIAAQSKDYPLATCPVSDEKLGDHGTPVEYVVANRLVRLCCKGCVGAVEKDPLKFISLVDKARGVEPLPGEEQPTAAPAKASAPAPAAQHGHEGHNH